MVTVLQVETRKGARIHAALGQDQVWGDDPTSGRETVSRYLSRHPEAIAAINASFFALAGNPIGLHVEDGEMVTEAALGRSVFCVMKNGKARIERLAFIGKVTVGKESVRLDGLNRRPGKGNELLLFTPRFGRTTLRAPGRVEIVLSGINKSVRPRQRFSGKVRQISNGGVSVLAPGTVVLSGGGTRAEFLRGEARSGAKISVELDTRTMNGASFPVQDIREAVTGASRLVADGKEAVNVVEERLEKRFSTMRHPRTAVGITKRGDLLLFIVDGRQKRLSRGASLPELARLIMKWGAVDAVNLDGGGSSVIAARGLLLNAPSEGRERPVANFLTVTAKNAEISKKGKIEKARFNPPPRPLRVGETWTLVSPVQKEGTGLWGLPGGQPIAGFVSQRGIFHAVRPGTASISWLPRTGEAVTLPVRVVAPTPTTTRPLPLTSSTSPTLLKAVGH